MVMLIDSETFERLIQVSHLISQIKKAWSIHTYVWDGENFLNTTNIFF